MSLYSASVSFKTEERIRLRDVLAIIHPNEPAYISVSIGGWTTVVTATLDSFSESAMMRLVSPICSAMKCEAVGLTVIGSDLFRINVFDHCGLEVGRFERTNAVHAKAESQDIVKVIARMAANANCMEQLQSTFVDEMIYAESVLYDVIQVLGIEHAGVSYDILQNEGFLNEDPLHGWERPLEV